MSTCDPLKYKMDNPILIVAICIGKSTSIERNLLRNLPRIKGNNSTNKTTTLAKIVSLPTSTSTSTWLHAAVNHDFCSAGGCVLKRIKRNNRKVRSEKKKRRFDRKGRRKIKFDQMHFIPSILSSLASLEVPGPTKSPPA